MCELLGMSANTLTDICFSFTGLKQRGGATGPHKDGWGTVFYQGRGYRSFHEPQSSTKSEIANLLQRYPIKSHIVISHIRKRNRGRVCLENTHPFIRELWGNYWAFAHNGQLKGIKKEKLAYCHPVGTTDSEHAFCWLLDRIRNRFPSKPKNKSNLWEYINELFLQLNERGVFNALLCDTEHLYAMCGTKLSWIKRQTPFGKAKLIDVDLVADFSQHTTPGDIVSVIATTPLTNNEVWNRMEPGNFLVFKNGLVCR